MIARGHRCVHDRDAPLLTPIVDKAPREKKQSAGLLVACERVRRKVLPVHLRPVQRESSVRIPKGELTSETPAPRGVRCARRRGSPPLQGSRRRAKSRKRIHAFAAERHRALPKCASGDHRAEMVPIEKAARSCTSIRLRFWKGSPARSVAIKLGCAAIHLLFLVAQRERSEYHD
jgi:hypothetical protein